MKYEKLVTEITLKPEGQELFANGVTKVQIDDEGAGMFLVLSQSRDDGEQTVKIDPEEWPILCEVVAGMLADMARIEAAG